MDRNSAQITRAAHSAEGALAWAILTPRKGHLYLLRGVVGLPSLAPVGSVPR